MKVDKKNKTIVFERDDIDWVIVVLDKQSNDYIPIKIVYTDKVFGIELFKGFKTGINLDNLRIFFDKGKKHIEVDYLAVWKMVEPYLSKYAKTGA